MSLSLPKTPVILVDGSIETAIVITASPFTVGRAPDRDLVLSHPYVSRKHAEIVFEEGAFFVVDMASRHGTFVNGIRADRQRLSTNDAHPFRLRRRPGASLRLPGRRQPFHNPRFARPNPVHLRAKLRS